MADETTTGPDKKVKIVKDILDGLKLKKIYENLAGTTMRSPVLGRPVRVDSAVSNPRLYLRMEARAYVAKDGQGRFPILDLFDISKEQIEEIAKG